VGKGRIFVDACALVAVLSDELESDRVSAALISASERSTSPSARFSHGRGQWR